MPAIEEEAPTPGSAGIEPKEYEYPTTVEEVQSHITWVIQTCTQSVNDRTFDKTPSWEYFAPHFRVEGTAYRAPLDSKAALIEEFKKTCIDHPELQLGIPECTTEVHMKQGWGQTYSSASHTGASGLTAGSMSRKHVTVFYFSRNKEGRWTIQSESAVPGENIFR